MQTVKSTCKNELCSPNYAAFNMLWGEANKLRVKNRAKQSQAWTNRLRAGTMFEYGCIFVTSPLNSTKSIQ